MLLTTIIINWCKVFLISDLFILILIPRRVYVTLLHDPALGLPKMWIDNLDFFNRAYIILDITQIDVAVVHGGNHGLALFKLRLDG